MTEAGVPRRYTVTVPARELRYGDAVISPGALCGVLIPADALPLGDWALIDMPGNAPPVMLPCTDEVTVRRLPSRNQRIRELARRAVLIQAEINRLEASR